MKTNQPQKVKHFDNLYIAGADYDAVRKHRDTRKQARKLYEQPVAVSTIDGPANSDKLKTFFGKEENAGAAIMSIGSGANKNNIKVRETNNRNTKIFDGNQPTHQKVVRRIGTKTKTYEFWDEKQEKLITRTKQVGGRIVRTRIIKHAMRSND